MSKANKRRSKSRKRGENPDSIPTDLIIEIFSRLRTKSIVRFRCVSKLWRSMLHCPYFTELFLTRSLARSRLLFGVEGFGEWLFYSLPQPQHPYEKSLVVTADFHTKFRVKINGEGMSYASGLIYFPNTLCNPITGQYAILPKLIRYRMVNSFLGFDPVDKQFKVLCEAYPFSHGSGHHKILTLGTEKLRWKRKNHFLSYINSFYVEDVCINGVLYYLAEKAVGSEFIVCFDVRSEKFKFIEAECISLFDKLINYKGKLGGIELICDVHGAIVEIGMWILEDMKIQIWSKYVYTLPPNNIVDHSCFSVAGVTATGEIVLTKDYTFTSKPFYVFYFNIERNTLRKVEIQGFEALDNRGKVLASLCRLCRGS
ncbi:unnamed protein product [Arabidopsis lyrata]|uniref:F-box protein At3g57590 n=1 Tax=Arabidopsis lyrata subsp. lyrata TaxID=81972 RepID=UPI000A29BC64|nr:F-box protein At3g57590 [Arabidopsis lyrata subsp. lyrata]CAH8262151.1 unnamed protein product [Arabidopsis lyrata]|eukprot:XP_020888987.1 F-box protein At3g57590 [Arabidopsis lyrata subsp. lyrata]